MIDRSFPGAASVAAGTRLRALLAAVLVGVTACGGDASTPTQFVTVPIDSVPLRALAETHSLHIGIGTAVGSLFGTTDAVGTQYMTVLAREFNVITPENDMKFSVVQPTQGTFKFDRADSIVAFAQAHNMRVRGHTLAWYNQLPGWLTSGTWTTAQAKALLDDHIQHVVTHYRGQLAAWDVVNEALNDGSGTLRSGFWADNIGRGYIEQAFVTAHAADPAVRLFYNDYGIEGLGTKSDSVYAMLRDFKARGVPVDGVGMQMHLVVGQVPSTLAQNMARFAALGLEIQITELDVRVPTPSTAASLQTQAANYREVFDVCLQQPACNMVVSWGFTDRASWVPSTFPGQGEALLFDANFAKKPAYAAVHDLLAGK